MSLRNELPLEILGLLGPILCWTDDSAAGRHPERWLGGSRAIEERLRSWMLKELPTYSHDNLDEIWRLAQPRLRPDTARPLALEGELRVAPPRGYDLTVAQERLGRRYFQWAGNELLIRAGRMKELHELALRFPVRHLIRFLHARAVTTGVLRDEHALRLPETMSGLHATSHGIRVVIDRGLSEGHLHLWGITSANETWAHHLLGPAAAPPGFSAADRRLLLLGRAALRLLALGSLHWRLGLDGSALSEELILYFDQLFAARDRGSETAVWQRLEDTFRAHLEALPCCPARVDEKELDGLLSLVSPAARFLWRCGHRTVAEGAAARPAGLRHRLETVERLHFTVQRLLIELRTPPSPDAEDTGLEPPSGAPVTGLDGPLRNFVHEVFYRYLVLHTHHWNLATQSGTTTGLREFRKYYGASQRRLGVVEGGLEEGLAFERLSSSSALKIVEGRISPPRSAEELVPWILSYVRAAREGRLEKFGLVIHFIKSDLERQRSHPVAARPPEARHGRIRRETRAQALRLYRLLSEPHPAVPFIVGIDAANLELTTPPEVFAPVFRFLRELPIELRRPPRHVEEMGGYAEIASLVEQRRLGMTFHVGEDFRHLLSGLRAIHEVIEFFHPRPGDRLGHALALALDPEVWAAQLGFQSVGPRLELLDTFVWIHHLLGSDHPLISELAIADRIHRLAHQLYGHATHHGHLDSADLVPQTLHDAWLLRQVDPSSFDANALSQGRGELLEPQDPLDHERRWIRVQKRALRELLGRVGASGAYKLFFLYIYDGAVRQQGERIELLDMQAERGGRERWMELCREAQTRMQGLVERRQLVIEVNPSSNRVVGPMSRFDEHPIFRLTLDDELRPRRDIRVTVNSDDPGVFSTSLAHEYYLLAEILDRHGVPEPQVVSWLEWLRANGEDYSFVRPLPSLEDPRMATLVALLEKRHRRLAPRLGEERPRLTPQLTAPL